MAIYSKCPHKMKASSPPFLYSLPKTCSTDHSYSPDTHLHWASWKDMFENVFPLKETKFHMPSIFCSLFLSVSWVVNSHCMLCYPRTGKIILLLNWTFFIHRFLWKRNNIFSICFLGIFKKRSNTDTLSNYNKEAMISSLISFFDIICTLHMHLYFFTIPYFGD